MAISQCGHSAAKRGLSARKTKIWTCFLTAIVAIVCVTTAYAESDMELTVGSIAVRPSDSVVQVPIYLLNTEQTVAAFQLQIPTSDPFILRFPDEGVIDSTGSDLATWSCGATLLNPDGAIVRIIGSHHIGSEDYIYPDPGERFLLSLNAVLVDTMADTLCNYLGEIRVDPLPWSIFSDPLGTSLDWIGYNGGYVIKCPVCGDADASLGVDIDDVVYLIAYIFSGGPEPDPYESGDADLSGGVDIDDVVYIISYIFSGGHAPCEPVINEVRYDDEGIDFENFAELKGAPGASLDGYSLVGVNGSGSDYAVIDLSGHTIPPDGYFVVSQIDADYADLVSVEADFRNGPDNIQLRYEGQAVDALGYGDFGGHIFAGEGNPAPDTPAGSSLSRFPDGSDADDNSVDFIITAIPTPGSENTR
jgi:hypothetical protein